MVFDHAFKRTLARLLSGCAIEENASVGFLPLQVDIIATCELVPLEGTRVPVLASRFSFLNIIEYKSRRDTPKEGDKLEVAIKKVKRARRT